MHPAWIAGAVAIALWVVIRRRRHRKPLLALGVLAAAGALLIGLGVIELPNVEHLIEEAGQALGKWTYLAVGILAFLETGAFIGLVAPGETTVIVGGLVAGQGEISLMVLIAIVWTCAVLGDVTSPATAQVHTMAISTVSEISPWPATSPPTITVVSPGATSPTTAPVSRNAITPTAR